MSRKTLPLLFALIVLLLAQMACGTDIGIPVTGPDLVGTAAYATVNAQMTQQAYDNLVLKLTQIAQVAQTQTAIPATATPTNTMVPPTSTATPTNTFTPTATATRTPVPATATITPVPCYRVQFVSDVTVSDGTTFSPGHQFVKTWRLKNAGSCTWTSDFDLVFVSGSALGAASTIDTNASVTPGQTVDYSITFTAPSGEGSYTGNWELRSPSGVIFGFGPASDKAFWVNINVKKNSGAWNSNHKGDFIFNFCQANWRSGAGVLGCPSNSENFSSGSVMRITDPVLEGGYQENEDALVMIPSSGDGGTISGRFPALKVSSGQHFTAMIGCMDKSPNCNATLQLNYSINGGTVQNLGTWQETSDKKFHHIDVDLNSLAGKTVQFILKVNNNGSSKGDRIFWIAAAID